ncbi:aminoglycoside phosphotransferase family enzyme/predicted kinase [Oxalobacteraceae bacterium GrIS 1.11]
MPESRRLATQEALIRALIATLEREEVRVELIETHISWVLVTASYAYKIKKALRFDFLDFATLAARHFYCQEELRLNRRLAPALYLDVVTVRGSAAHPVLGGDGPVLEYAVRMRAFAQQALWSRRLDGKQLKPAEIDQLGHALVSFHQEAAVAPSERDWGTPAALRAIADANLDLLATLADGAQETADVLALRGWQQERHARLHDTFLQRRVDAKVRECHGDLHCGNIITVDDRVDVFDCIEFNESLRWTDVMNDLAFICMDLAVRARPELAARLLNGYLERGGDYAGLAVLRYYQIECALVRWKVGWLQARRFAARDAVVAERYQAFALQSMRTRAVPLIILHGLSGSGKSTLARQLVELLGAVQIRADVERKRLHGIGPAAPAPATVGAGLYDAAASRATYARLRQLAASVVRAGWPVLIDATFLRGRQRHLFRALAGALGVPFFILDVQADVALLRSRVRGRVAARAHAADDPSDAGLAVLAHQLGHRDPLTQAELGHVIRVDTDAGLDRLALRELAGTLLAGAAC